MLKILIPTILLIPMTLLLNQKLLLMSFTTLSMLIALSSLTWLHHPPGSEQTFFNQLMFTDPLSSPLLILSCWLLPLMSLASQNLLRHEPKTRQQMFLTTLTTLQILLILTFSATNLTLFYITFEATLIPTMIIITRWGHQTERLTAGIYFMFYTLASSLPLLIVIIYYNTSTMPTYFTTTALLQPQLKPTWNNTLMWYGCLMAFMVKMPMYGLHLWLPKAHVEAPIAGSMVLAAILLKLGGYGIIRISTTLLPMTKNLLYPLLTLALWGILMTSSICLRQTDLKSMIAYSSVSHMGLVICATLTQTQLSLNGATLLMIAHGLTSSMLFCLANTNYERTHSRTLLLTRGMHTLLPLMSLWWLSANLTNMALPPSINLMGELFIISALFNWTPLTIIITGAGTLLSACYSLYMYLMTQHGKLPKHLMTMKPSHTLEHLLMTLHLIPLMLLITKPELIMY